MVMRYFVGKIQEGLSSLLIIPRRHAVLTYFNGATRSAVPDDVMEGYFAVLAKKGEETRRFVVGLEYLADPAFLGLLEQAREEYGFRHKGALVVPCRPQDLQNILDHRYQTLS